MILGLTTFASDNILTFFSELTKYFFFTKAEGCSSPNPKNIFESPHLKIKKSGEKKIKCKI
ncbi:hypothetical protein BpHYR1_003347 [Brachionus plicatilis]|uniref:Uncharacterized protein n=1 Tax=Brachionus plicatilis TaxID=10195 RepID=A0A3M7R9Y0_BRAPC|nr:hypothetical protein BpHYR1_003347 [Brachionus plicatilis]